MSSQVVTCVKLKYVQQPVGKRAGGSGTIIRPSKRIIYDTNEAVVSFLSEDVDKCVDEFLEEWARVSKMVVIAREGKQCKVECDAQDFNHDAASSCTDVKGETLDRRPITIIRSSDRGIRLRI